MAKKKEMCSLENHESGAGIVLMKLEELHSFEGHPFKVERNQELFELRCSIEKEGVLVPLLVRKNPHGDGYEIWKSKNSAKRRSRRQAKQAQKKQKEAEKKIEQAESKARNEKKRAELEIRKAKKEVKNRTENMKAMEYFWGMGYITVVLFAILQNGAFQHDFIDFFRTPFMWYFQFCEWLAHPTYDNGFNQKIAYTCGEAWVIRILAIVAVLLIVVIIMAIIMEIIKKYKKMWDKISQMFLIGSLSGIAVLGDVIREYLPVNLILTFVFINVGIMLLKIYFQKKFEEKSLYADNHYD